MCGFPFYKIFIRWEKADMEIKNKEERIEMKEKIFTIVMIFLIFLISTTGAKGPEEVKAEWNYVICIVLRIVQFVAIGISALIIILAGIKLMTSENLEERGGAKKMMIQVISGLIIIIIAVQLVNYIVTGSRVEKFDLSACEDVFPTTTTTTTMPVTTTTVIVTTTISSTTSTTTTVPGSTTDQGICYNAENNDLCDGLDIVFGPGYRQGCCTEWGCCCTPPSPPGVCTPP